MRKFYWYISAYFRKHGWVLITTVIIGILISSFFIPLIAQRLETKPKRYIGMVGSYSLITLPDSIQERISTGLTQIEPDGTVSPQLASRWSVDDDNRTYRFVIRENIKWQDGSAFQPTDINYQFPDVEVITTQQDIVFKLPDSFVPFTASVAQPLFRIENQRYFLWLERPTLIGLGEYRVIDYREQGPRLNQITLDSNKERLIYRFYLTESEAITAFKLGEVDSLVEISDPAELDEWPDTSISGELEYDKYQAIFFDLANPLFQKNVRQALAYALQKPTGEERAIGPISPESWAYLPGGKDYEYDQNRAIERLLSSLPEQPLIFELATTPSFVNDAEKILQQWEELGQKAYDECQASSQISKDDKPKCENVKIDVNLRVQNFPDTSNFQTLLIGQEVPADPDQYQLWHSEQPTNFTHYKNTRIDSLLEKGRQVSDRQERLAIYQEFQQFFLEDVPVIFLEHLTNYTISRQ